MSDLAVQVKNLVKRFGNFTAVDDVSFDVRSGEIFGFLGANGAGKTTVIKMLCGLLPPTSGEASVAGFDLKTQTRSIKKSIGYMSQKFSLYEDLSVSENIQFYGGVYGLSRTELSRKTDDLLHELNMTQHASDLTGSIPLGWKQRLALSTALLHDPQVIFLDEPTGGVDPISRRTFWNIIHSLADKGKTVFVTTHYMDEAEYCHRISIMHAGKIIAMGKPSELKARFEQTSIQDVFIHLIGGQ